MDGDIIVKEFHEKRVFSVRQLFVTPPPRQELFRKLSSEKLGRTRCVRPLTFQELDVIFFYSFQRVKKIGMKKPDSGKWISER